MDSPAKSYRALNVAQPIKKEIDQILLKVELEKRRFLASERQENNLKQILDKRKKELTQLRLKQPENKGINSKTIQTSLSINNVDRNQQKIIDNIQHLKATIDVHRRQIFKYKNLTQKLIQDCDQLSNKNDQIQESILKKQTENEQLKDQIYRYRELNLKNASQFQTSHLNLNRTSSRDDNTRKKFSMEQKTFLGEEMKNEKIIPVQNLSDLMRNSGILHTGVDGKNQVMTLAVPLARYRIKQMMQMSKEKLKIIENYRKFGENLENMFLVMKQYKGRDDINFIAEEFVIKQKQLQKIEEYIGKLENRITSTKTILTKNQKSDEQLKQQVNTVRENLSDKHYLQLRNKLLPQIEQMKRKQKQSTEWLQKVSSILQPLTEDHLTRGNANLLIGNLEAELLPATQSKIPQQHASKVAISPQIDLHGDKTGHNQLMTYDKIRQFAVDYVKGRKA